MLLVPISLLVSCSKEVNQQPAVNNGTLLKRMQQGTDPNTDTVYKIIYNSFNKVEMIVDTDYNDTLFASYNAQGRLAAINKGYAFSASYNYDGTGLLTEINTVVVGQNDQFVFTYVGGLVSEKKWNTQATFGGGLSLWETFKYTFNDGNITNIKEYRFDGTLVSDKEFQYGLEPNPFKDLSLFNVANILGTDPIFNNDTFFNKNILEGYTAGNYNESNTNFYDNVTNSDLLIKTLAFVPGSNSDYDIYTWQFYYE